MKFAFRLAIAAGLAACGALCAGGSVGAEPFEPFEPYDPVTKFDRPQRLPVVVPSPSNWQPKFPPPYDVTKQFITDRDINAQREMCQWYSQQYMAIKRQISGLNNAVVRANGNWTAPGVPEQADIVTANIDQSLAFLTPRVDSLTRSFNRAGDMYFPLYQGDSFHGLWQQMFNVKNGLSSRQPTWFSGPSYHQMQFWGSKIDRSRVCD